MLVLVKPSLKPGVLLNAFLLDQTPRMVGADPRWVADHAPPPHGADSRVGEGRELIFIDSPSVLDTPLEAKDHSYSSCIPNIGTIYYMLIKCLLKV